MNLTPITSSNVAAAGYQDDYLILQFKNGATYRYDDAPYSLFQGLMAAPSAGKFVNERIKGLPCEKVELFKVMLSRVETYAEVRVWATDEKDAKERAKRTEAVNQAEWKVSEGNHIDPEDVESWEASRA